MPSRLLSLGPLRNSFVVDEVERELRDLFVSLFDAYIGPARNDENVLGMAHLGSTALIERLMHVDGLALPNHGDAQVYQYLYRAWKGRNSGRGLHFLRTCLQLIWPEGGWSVEQLMQAQSKPYPTALSPRSVSETDTSYFLTSRVRISFEASMGNSAELPQFTPVFRSILPARIVPQFAVAASGIASYTVGGIFSGTQLLYSSGSLSPPGP